MRFPRTLFAACAALLPGLAAAHPHVFVSAEIEVIYAEGRPVAVEVAWIYDDFFSLLITSDLGIDDDGDLQLTPAEEAVLAEAVTDWPADFEGDLWLTQGEDALTLGPREDHRMEFRDGLVHELHRRPITDGGAGPLEVAVYDPFYFVAYDVTDASVAGRADCEAAILRADLAAANAMVEELIGRPAAEVGPDEEMPRVGHAFADRITVTCASDS